MQLASKTFEVADLESAAEYCYERRWTDGLPVIPPTRPAIERIIDYLERDPKEVVGIIPPRSGIATIEKIAINCVMAGCKPEYVPFVIASIEAMLEERFNLNGVQTTTHSCAPLVVVSGPAVKRLGFNTKEGAFGHGCRPSAAIGRAVRLILWNGGGGYPGEPCKTSHGHPGYYSFCVAEDTDTNPWEPLNVEYGFGPDETIVTITATTGPHTIGTGAGYSSADDVLFVLSDSLCGIGTPNYSGGCMVLALGQLTARNLAQAGLSKAEVKAELMKRSTRSVRDLKRRRSIAESHPMHWSHIADPNDDDARAALIRDPDDLVLFVTGGLGSGGATSSLCPGWGPPGGYTVKRRVQFP